MVRNAIADENLYPYFNSVAKQNPCSVGLILGQYVNGRDYVIHFAKTPSFQTGDSSHSTPKVIKNIGDISEEWVADHARQATRMLPGGMHVLGIFVVSQQDVMNPFSPKIKAILSAIHNSLESHPYLFGNPNDREKLVLSYCTITYQYSSKSYNVETSVVKPVDFKFVPDAMKWNQIECKYELDQVNDFQISNSKSPLKKHMTLVLDKMSENLKSAVFLFDGELKSSDECIETIGKKKIPRGKVGIHEDSMKPVQVCIIQRCKEETSTLQVSNVCSQIRMFGHVACKLWLHPKMTISGACEAIMQDILRSLSTRLDMHWDSLTEEEHGEDMNSVHEPPRRVLVALPYSKIEISDYLFPGEGPQDAQSSLEEMLDIRLKNVSDVKDIEGQADLTEYCNEALDSSSVETVVQPVNQNRLILSFGALSVLFLAVVIPLVIFFRQET